MTLTDYLEDALPAAERAWFDAHLARCEGCISYMDQMRQTIRLMGQLNEDAIAPAARDKLLEVFRNWQQST
jgi:anti-sigma factor RsiW